MNHLKAHYQSSPFITPTTSLSEFMERLELNYHELLNCYADDLRANSSPSDDFMREVAEVMLSASAILHRYHQDVPGLINKAIKRNEGHRLICIGSKQNEL